MNASGDFARDGYRLERGLCPPDLLARVQSAVSELERAPTEPLEYEAETGYPGAPQSREAAGGSTLRRIKDAWPRHAALREWAVHPPVLDRLEAELGRPVVLSRAHHNCVMFKHPEYGSRTNWHQDMRYWRFERPELITTWLALGDADEASGCLRVIPGSHRLTLAPERFDKARFLRDELPENQALLADERPLPMRAGDVLFFHCLLLHAAHQNASGETRRSLIFTYRNKDNAPVAGTRSADFADPPVRDANRDASVSAP